MSLTNCQRFKTTKSKVQKILNNSSTESEEHLDMGISHSKQSDAIASKKTMRKVSYSIRGLYARLCMFVTRYVQHKYECTNTNSVKAIIDAWDRTWHTGNEIFMSAGPLQIIFSNHYDYIDYFYDINDVIKNHFFNTHIRGNVKPDIDPNDGQLGTIDVEVKLEIDGHVFNVLLTVDFIEMPSDGKHKINKYGFGTMFYV
jgi:hypothetical protein